MKITRELYNALEECGLDGIRDDYSGRFMYGRNCLGFTCNPGQFYGLLMDLYKAANYDGDETLAEEISDFITSAPDLSIDSLGLGNIFYFPSVEVEEGEE